MKRNFVILGLPGSGKGTQSKLLSAKFALGVVATGDMLRRIVSDSYASPEHLKIIRESLEAGRLITDDLMISMLSTYLTARSALDGGLRGYMFDGFPRNKDQAIALDSFLHKQGYGTVNLVINLVVNDEEIIKRLAHRLVCIRCAAVYNSKTCRPKKDGVCDICRQPSLIARTDDDGDVMQKRLMSFKPLISELLFYYESRVAIVNVDATTSVDKIFCSICSHMEKIYAKPD